MVEADIFYSHSTVGATDWTHRERCSYIFDIVDLVATTVPSHALVLGGIVFWKLEDLNGGTDVHDPDERWKRRVANASTPAVEVQVQRCDVIEAVGRASIWISVSAHV